ncbi:MAG: FAD-binding protein, partial [Muribaculaceae bacterium]|nr:FAD-binding protein [Muribaculaceae bacterium]
HPHIGTDRLPEVIKSIRNTILRYGGEVRFNTRVVSLIINGDKVEGVEMADGSKIFAPVILATGHSARDLYCSLNAQGVDMEAKGIAVGVRLEHPQQLIDAIQYHKPGGRGKFLPPAEYSLLTRVDDRAVYSFCMCPGGVVVPCASAPGQQAVNGMSPSNRGTRWANSGMVVEVLPDDVEPASNDPLKIMRYQEDIERKFFSESGSSQNAPAQRMHDFVNSKPSANLPSTSYAPGIHSARIDQLLPKSIAKRLQKGFQEFGRKQRGFLTNDAILIGAETRTSSPVRLKRDSETLQHVRLKGLYPCGEGAGYAGGIVSAAIDGQRCAQAVARSISRG